MRVVLRSLRNRLSIVFGAIVLSAIAIVYFSIAPQLEGRLRDQKLESLAADLRSEQARIAAVATDARRAGLRVREAGARAGAEVTLYDVFLGEPSPTLIARADSAPSGGVELEDVASVTSEALATGRVATGTEPTRSGRQALAAAALNDGAYVVVFADALTDVQRTVATIRRQILVSGAVALFLAILAGFFVARALALRVRRLEQAARQVAAGDFSARIAVDSEDELGRLARAFDDMQQQLARLDTARKQFIASASHELRTPIFSLGGFLELLEDEDLDDATREQFMAQIRGQTERLRNLATELLDLSRMESGALELRPEPTDIGDLVRDVAGEFTPAVHHHRAKLAVEVGEEPIEIECDPERVAQVLRILLDNAMVHTPPGTAVRVSAAREDGHVRLDVTDAGLGIKRQTMPHIFEPFFTSNNDAQGAGLGLAIARELAENMHGHLDVRSIPGRTTFSLVLPV